MKGTMCRSARGGVVEAIAQPCLSRSSIPNRSSTQRRLVKLHAESIARSRRSLFLSGGMALLFAVSAPRPAEAGTFLTLLHKNQQNKILKLLAPLKYSLDKLLEAQRQAASGDYSEALKAVRVAGLNCYPFSEEADDVTTFAQRVSSFQEASKTTEVCTYRLVLKNVLVRPEDESKKDEAFDLLADLEMRFRELDITLAGARAGEDAAKERVGPAFRAAMKTNEDVQEAITALIMAEW